MGRFDLEGKVVLVTGGARGIGYETARIAHAKGAAIALVDLDRDATEGAARRLGERAIGLGADVTDREAMSDAVDRVAEQLGRLDVVVANAGIAPRAATLNAMDQDVFERVIDVNVLGVWRTVQPALTHVIAGGGQVVVVASIYAFVNGALLAPYAVSKAGVEQLGRALRTELAQHGASASVAYFGFIDTEMTRSTLADPIAERFEAEFPGVLRRPLPAEAAGAAIVRGIERRAPRIIAPRRWAPVSALRGVLNPLVDRRMERNAALQAILREADQPAAAVTLA
jgi:NAD(P)-dependent dehydrogenase (short-subunit alcohol dehydrogenase family)